MADLSLEDWRDLWAVRNEMSQSRFPFIDTPVVAVFGWLNASPQTQHTNVSLRASTAFNTNFSTLA
jgi:hypothetical protein